MKKPQSIFVMDHYQVAFFDEKGEQVADIQKKNLLALLAEHAERHGFNIEGVTIETSLGNFKAIREDGELKIRRS